MIEATRLVFTGRLRSISFLDFMHHRAARLSLCVRTEFAGDEMVEVFVSGETALIDAFELACGLGPIDCLVRDYHRVKPSASPTLAGSGDIKLRKEAGE